MSGRGSGSLTGGGGSALHSRKVSCGLRTTRLRREPLWTGALCRHTAFSSQPASSASILACPLFLTVNCITVAGSEESSVFSGTNGENASSDTLSRALRIPVLDAADRVLAAKRDLAPARTVERADLHLIALRDQQRKALIQRRGRRQRTGVMLRPGAHVPVEDVPMPQLAVAAQVQLPGTEAADGHADFVEFRSAVDGRLAPRRERLDPVRRQPFVGRHQLFKILRLKRPRDGRAGAAATWLPPSPRPIPGTGAAWRWAATRMRNSRSPWLLDASDMMFSCRRQEPISRLALACRSYPMAGPRNHELVIADRAPRRSGQGVVPAGADPRARARSRADPRTRRQCGILPACVTRHGDPASQRDRRYNRQVT